MLLSLRQSLVRSKTFLCSKLPFRKASLYTVKKGYLTRSIVKMATETKQEERRECPIPEEGKRNILITSALPYVNNVPHLGNLIGCVLSADVYARFTRLRGYNSIYVCGTDEYGTATEMRARKEGVSPEEICRKYYQIHKDIYKWFEIDFNIFGRTSTKQQTEITQEIFLKLEENGCTVEKDVEQLTCKNCGPLADRFVTGTCPICESPGANGDQCDMCTKIFDSSQLINPKCKQCSSKPELRTSRHIFITLPKLSEKLSKWSKASAEKGGWSDNSRATTEAWIKGGLEDRCITRDLKWGTRIPKKGYEDKVFYVWFDAPIGYISITANLTDQWKKWWQPTDKDVELVQFMGKDNVPFHTVIFPCTLIGADDNYTLLHNISVTEYLNYEPEKGKKDPRKFSKTNQMGVFGDEARKTDIPPYIWRYYLLSVRPETSDTVFNWDDLQTKNHSLLANVGNFANRSLTLLWKYFDGKIPEIHPNDLDRELIESVSQLKKNYIDTLERVKLKAALLIAQDISQHGNRYLQGNKPWELAKGFWDVGGKTRCGTVVGIAVNLVKVLALCLEPYMPGLTIELCKQLNIPRDGLNLKSDVFELELPEGHQINKAKPIIREITIDEITKYREMFGGVSGEEKQHEFPLDLVVGTVVHVEDHPNRDTNWVLKVRLGQSDATIRQIVTNLKSRPGWNVDLILNKKVIVLNNIKKEKFQGVKSEGMLMCAQDDDGIVLLTIDVPDGQRVVPKGAQKKSSKRFNYKKKFKDLGLRTDENSVPCWGDLELCVEDVVVSLSGEKPNAALV